jgi:hypothetical protein
MPGPSFLERGTFVLGRFGYGVLFRLNACALHQPLGYRSTDVPAGADKLLAHLQHLTVICLIERVYLITWSVTRSGQLRAGFGLSPVRDAVRLPGMSAIGTKRT